jgi:hypothetical protein
MMVVKSTMKVIEHSRMVKENEAVKENKDKKVRTNAPSRSRVEDVGWDDTSVTLDGICTRFKVSF